MSRTRCGTACALTACSALADPEGAPPDQDHVRFDHEALLGILCLEHHRAGAFVVGGYSVSSSWVREVLADRGVLGTSIRGAEAWPPSPPTTCRPPPASTSTCAPLAC